MKINSLFQYTNAVFLDHYYQIPFFSQLFVLLRKWSILEA